MANLDSLELGEGVAAGPSNFHEEYESCADLNLTPSGEEITDVWGDGCLRYTFFPDWCGEEYDTEDFISGDMCCVCGGGNVGAGFAVGDGVGVVGGVTGGAGLMWPPALPSAVLRLLLQWW